jgi:hypothetical protein
MLLAEKLDWKVLSRITWTETEIYTAVKTERAPRQQQALRDK